MSTKKSLAAIALALPLALLLGACASGSSEPAGSGDASGSSDTVRIGVVGAGDPYWETYKEAAADEGINVEIVNFDSYDQPNPALSAGELDLNQFQHLQFLADYNTKAWTDAKKAFFVLGSKALGPMNDPNLPAFATRPTAEAFAKARRG